MYRKKLARNIGERKERVEIDVQYRHVTILPGTKTKKE